jgi:hypothetical protein
LARRRTPRAAGEAVASVLAGYAARGTLQPLAAPLTSAAVAGHAFRWFRDREFRLRIDERAQRLCLEGVLEGVAPRSALDRALRAWLRERQASTLPAHRRIDPAHAALSALNRGGQLALVLRLHDGDWTRGARELIHLLNELYLVFLPSGAHFEWLVERFGLDPDNPRWP